MSPIRLFRSHTETTYPLRTVLIRLFLLLQAISSAIKRLLVNFSGLKHFLNLRLLLHINISPVLLNLPCTTITLVFVLSSTVSVLVIKFVGLAVHMALLLLVLLTHLLLVILILRASHHGQYMLVVVVLLFLNLKSKLLLLTLLHHAKLVELICPFLIIYMRRISLLNLDFHNLQLWVLVRTIRLQSKSIII
ncbi:MAG: hypothetical protein EBY83_06335, partial [Verrucomicrobia bacterium]|nr:hypothetical protein [Verrucomicrobiota bacterium]